MCDSWSAWNTTEYLSRITKRQDCPGSAEVGRFWITQSVYAGCPDQLCGLVKRMLIQIYKHQRDNN